LISGCFGEDGSDTTDSADAATIESLREAYTALEAAANDSPTARLPRIDQDGEVEIVEEGEKYHAAFPPKDLGLLDYFNDRGIAFGLALIDDPSERGLALSGIEFTNATGSLELIIPEDLRYGSARELLAGGATFATIAPSGEIYCIDDAEMGVESCPAPDLPNE